MLVNFIMKDKVTIVGAGLVGCLFAIQLAKRGHIVYVYEKRSDIRNHLVDGGRSINLIVTSRGIHALEKVGIEQEVFKITVPVYGRMIHNLEGDQKYQPYGRSPTECNYSISRLELNKLLLNLAEESGVKIFFKSELNNIDFNEGVLNFSTGSITSNIIIGSDGGGSTVRKSLMSFLKQERIPYKYHVDVLDAKYKELKISLADDGKSLIDKNALHIWPRGSHMLMALPNQDGSFTVTIYLPMDGPYCFNSLEGEEERVAFFNRFYKTALPLMPTLMEDWENNSVGNLATVRCDRWFYRDKVLLIGDAAHAIVPFFGQGMNSGFEDCSYFDKFYDEFSGDFGKVFLKFNDVQVPNASAIADMAIENFVEMKERVGDDRFLLRKAVEHKIEKTFPQKYRSCYGIVTYTLIPYSIAQKVGKIQEMILMDLIENMDSIEDLDLERAEFLIDKHLTPFLNVHQIELN